MRSRWTSSLDWNPNGLKGVEMEEELRGDYLPLSGIQHYAFCPRQWALIHLEQMWDENILTFQGRELHERVDDSGFSETRGDLVVTRSVPMSSTLLQLYGVADIVEFHRSDAGIQLEGRDGLWMPYPVEYKLGRPKVDHCDRVQLCAQAICLEEAYGIEITEGAIFYGRIRRRETVTFHAELRQETHRVAAEMRSLFAQGVTPKAKYTRACENCSLYEHCMPRLPVERGVDRYINSILMGE